MKPDNFAIALRTLSNRGKFRPFVVELVSGETIEIGHPEALALRGDFAVYIARDKSVTFLDHESVARVYEGSDPAAAAA